MFVAFPRLVTDGSHLLTFSFQAEKLVSLSIPQDEDTDDDREICPWFPNLPDSRFTVDLARRLLPLAFKEPLTFVYFGIHSPLKEIVIWLHSTPMPQTILCIEFRHEDPNDDVPFAVEDFESPCSNCFSHRMSIDGRLGEKIVKIQMVRHFEIRGLRVRSKALLFLFWTLILTLLIDYNQHWSYAEC